MDAFTQLLEAFTSTKANPITDALALSGMRQIKDSIIPVCGNEALDTKLRSSMAYGALLSGIVLANAGLGIVHGFASSIGGLFEIPHGVVCGTLIAECTRVNIKSLERLSTEGEKGLLKYALAGAIFSGDKSVDDINIHDSCSTLVNALEIWTRQLKIDSLSKYGVTTSDVDKIIKKTSLKNNPVQLKHEDLREILINRI
jgi:alcohol dehydrogenase class IV